jgi:hypothetical protein
MATSGGERDRGLPSLTTKLTGVYIKPRTSGNSSKIHRPYIPWVPKNSSKALAALVKGGQMSQNTGRPFEKEPAEDFRLLQALIGAGRQISMITNAS